MIITLQTEVSNASLQVGDIAYYSPGLSTYSISTSGTTTVSQTTSNVTDPPIKIGKINSISGKTITINNPVTVPVNGAFLMFQKNKTVNNTSLVGYYAEVKIKNNSIEEAELFALSSEAVESSK